MTILTVPQSKLKAGIYQAWDDGAQNVMAVSPTGSGKTRLAAAIAAEHNGYGVAIAHRASLVSQISEAYAAESIPHRIIAQPAVVNAIRKNHLEKFGKQFVNPVAPWGVASVDTLINRDTKDAFFDRCSLVKVDEAHHCLLANKWGRAFHMFPNARGLLLTASPGRADGKGLGRHADGIADALVLGQSMREAIDDGYLTDYEVYCPTPADLDLGDVPVSANGDFNMQALQKAMAKSKTVVGDVVKTYLKRARGKLGLTFAVGVVEAEKLACAYRAAGVPAAVVSGDMSEEQRAPIFKAFAARELLQLVSVDLIGEGVDMPALECISFARPTASFPLYLQMWGRVLRVLMTPQIRAVWGSLDKYQRLHYIANSTKPFGLIFDHVGNMLRHKGPADKYVAWTLDRRNKRAGSELGAIPMTICSACEQPFERLYIQCPYCGAAIPEPEPGLRMGPEAVDGDLYRVDPAYLEEMRREIARIDSGAFAPSHLTGYARDAVFKNHNDRQAAQHHLRLAIGQWAGMYAQHPDRENYRRFYHTFGLDVLAAKALGTADAETLRQRIVDRIAAGPYR